MTTLLSKIPGAVWITLYCLTCLFLSFWFWNEVAVGPWWYGPCAITIGVADCLGVCALFALLDPCL